MRDVLDRVVKPFKMLKEPDIALLLLYNSLSYTLYYCITSSASTLFKQHYHLDYAQIGRISYVSSCLEIGFRESLLGLAYLGIGMGTMVGTLGELVCKNRWP